MSDPARIVRLSGVYFGMSAVLVAAVMGVTGVLAERDFDRDLDSPLQMSLASYAATLEGGTTNSRAMGAAILFGLENRGARDTAKGKFRPGSKQVLADLEMLRTAYLADVALLVNRQGSVVAYRSGDGAPGLGADLSFRPYVQRALQGAANVYPAVGVISSRRGIFLAAPVRATSSRTSAPIGAVVIRVGADKLDLLLKSWTDGYAALVSPQGIVFASSRSDWLFQTTQETNAAQLAAVRQDHQFGHIFDQSSPRRAPFSADARRALLDGVPYAVRSVALDWDDASGDWTLTFLERRTPWWTHPHVLGLAGIAGLVTALLLAWYYFMRRDAYALDRMNARLRKSDELLRESQVIAGLGTYKLDLRSGAWESSELLNQLFGISGFYTRSLEGWTQLVHPDDRASLLDYLRDDVVARRQPFNREYRIVTQDQGTLRWVHGLGKLECDAQGDPVELHGTIQDISERKRAEEEIGKSIRLLEDKELAKTRFLAAAGHDLRQPLAAANLFIDALKGSQPTPHQDKIIQRLEQAMVTFNGLLDTLLNISRLDAGAIKPVAGPIEAMELANWLEQNFAPLAAEKRIAFKLSFPLRNPLVMHSDAGLVRSVLMNLVSNAIKFTAHGGVLVSIRRRGDAALVQVWDTGVGIGQEHLNRVFDEFYQVDNPQRDRERGLGLGLSIAQRAITLLGGRIECRSQPGRGSMFGFRLPVLHSGALPGAARAAATPSPGDALSGERFAAGKRFVVLEDDALVAQGLVNWLEGMGGTVASFHCVEDALRHGHLVADYYIVDYMLSGTLSGIQFLDELAARLERPLRAVLVTGDTSPSFFREAGKLRWPVLHKPVQVSRLIAALGAQEE